MDKTESYIILKPISERFNKIANEITDDEIKGLIKSELQRQFRDCNFTQAIGWLHDAWVEDNQEYLQGVFKKSIESKFKI